MNLFLDVRMHAVGGELAASVAINQLDDAGNYISAQLTDLLQHIRGQHVLIATHGFNVNRKDGIAHLANWESLLQLPQSSSYIGLLWPGDSVWAHGLDYPVELKIADQAGVNLLAPFIDKYFGDAASVSLASHSLGARLMLAVAESMSTRVRRAILMAGAVDNNCLIKEFKNATTNIDAISILASKKDPVLSSLFPLGNLLGSILDEGHPWFRAALGHAGPSKPIPANFKPPFEIPDVWEYVHADYLLIADPAAPELPIPTDVPPQKSPVFPKDVDQVTGKPIDGWQSAFSSAFASTRFR
jgi:hypothetical protein